MRYEIWCRFAAILKLKIQVIGFNKHTDKLEFGGLSEIQCRGRCPHRPSGRGFEFAEMPRKSETFSRGPMRASAPTLALQITRKFQFQTRHVLYLISYILYLISYILYLISPPAPLPGKTAPGFPGAVTIITYFPFPSGRPCG